MASADPHRSHGSRGKRAGDDEIEVPSKTTADLISYFTPKDSGRYVISGRVLYNKKLTFEKSSILNVNYAPTTERKLGLIPFLI